MDSTGHTDHPDTGFEVTRFTLDPIAHYIQARKAVEDSEAWRAATVVDAGDDTVTLAVGDWTTHEHLPPGQPLWISERRSVIAVPSESGNVFSTGYGREGSIFEIADADRLHFGTIRRIEHPDPEHDLLWTTLRGIDDIDRLLIAPRTDMRYITDVVEVMTSCTTWGEVREAASRDLYEELLIRAGRGSLEEYLAIAEGVAPVRGYEAELAKDYATRDHSSTPNDDEPFSAEDIEGYMCLDWPPTVPSIMHRIIPTDIAHTHGRPYRTVINGDYLDIDAEQAGPVITELRARGYRCYRDRVPFIKDMFRMDDLPG